MNGELRSLVVVGVVLGVVCAAVVWWLERFELDKMRQHMQDTLGTEAAHYLEMRDAFDRWLREHGRD